LLPVTVSETAWPATLPAGATELDRESAYLFGVEAYRF
jgi:hypothetical protein